MKNIVIDPFDPSSIDHALKEIEAYKKWLNEKTQEFLAELAKLAQEEAESNFSNAEYDGTNDVSVSVEDEGENRKIIVARGEATLFIEFGTGVTNPDNHPDKPPEIVGHGEYGYKLGSLEDGWRYKGEPGTNGIQITEGKHKDEILTKGNIANMCMYNTVKDLREKINDIAKRVFV